MMRALIFPGQGSQWEDMGKQLAERYESARRTFSQISEIIGKDVLTLCADSRALTKDTRAIQIAVFAVSAAALGALREEKRIDGDVFIGHSLGEVTAFHAAGGYDLETAAEIVQKRGEAMHRAGIENPGGMFVVNRRPMSELDELKKSSGAELANINSTVNGSEQVVFTGAIEEIDQVAAAFDPEDKRSFRLPIPIPAHHSQRMIQAREDLRLFVEGVKGRISDLDRPVIPNRIPANKIPQLVSNGQEAARHIYDQMTNGVNFAGGIAFMFKELGVNEVVEVGPKKVLTGLVSRYVKANGINAKLHTFGDDVDTDIAA